MILELIVWQNIDNWPTYAWLATHPILRLNPWPCLNSQCASNRMDQRNRVSVTLTDYGTAA